MSWPPRQPSSLQIDLSGYALPPSCERCHRLLDGDRLRRYPNLRFCSRECQRKDWRRRDRLAERDCRRAAPPPTPEQNAAIQAECWAAWEALDRLLATS